ncbi:aspartic peptidase domain-containing protein [Ampelomyces quisqualis]|uniref:Aspartic peptidase domain-containing protein n=1 Tax=Ampelomyces quisqualis TaxID=50730 RepID=A0A6A5QYP8_AMPQU|nr:aspartic peptidase domain-containing protein [Ampelomyces quisqualis]
MANVIVGDQVIPLVVDTGTERTWVATSSFRCVDTSGEPSSTCNFGHRFVPSKSKTLRQPIKEEFIMSYESGEFMKGEAFIEEISLGRQRVGHEMRPAFTIRQTIGIPEHGYWEGDSISAGALGLAFPRIPDRWSIVQTLFEHPDMDPVFSIALDRPSTTAGPSAAGVLAFGGIPNVNLRTDSWVRTPIIAPLPHAPEILAIGIDGFDITPPVGSSHTPKSEEAIQFISRRLIMAVDSGTSLIQAPPDIVEHIASLFDPPAWLDTDQNLWFMKCNAIAPTVSIKIRGKLFNISPEDLVTPRPALEENLCSLAIEPSISMYDWVLGEAWLRNVVVVFDYTSNRKSGGSGNNDAYGVLHIAAR